MTPKRFAASLFARWIPETRRLLQIKREHSEHLQLVGNYHVAGSYRVIISMGLRSQLVNVMCGDWILRRAIKLNDLHRTVGALQWVEAVGDYSPRVRRSVCGQIQMHPV